MIGNQFTTSSLRSHREDRLLPSDMALGVLIAATGLNISAILHAQYGIAILGKIAVAFVVSVLLIELLQRQRTEIRLDRLSVAVLLAFLVAAGLGILWAYSPRMAIDEFDSLSRDAIVAILAVIVVNNFASLRFAVRCFYLTLAGLASLSTFQMATGAYDFDFWGLARAGIDHLSGSVDSWRLYGPYGDPNSYGRILLVGVPLAAHELFSPSRRGWKLVGFCSLAVLLTALFGTYSRGALLGLVAAAVPVAIILRRFWLVQTVAVVLLIALVGQTSYGDRVGSALAGLGVAESAGRADPATLGRLDEMRLAGEMFRDNVWGGLGPGGYTERFQQYSSRHYAIPRHEDRKAHSLPLEMAAEGGILLLAAFSALCAILARNVVEAFRACRRRSPQEAGLVAGLGISMTGYLAASLVLHADFSRVFWLLCGLVLVLPICVSFRGQHDDAAEDEVRIPLYRAPSAP